MSMDADFKEMMKGDLDTFKADWSEIMLHKGSSIVGTFSPVTRADDLSDEGLLQTADAEFVCDTDEFNAMSPTPDVRDTVSIDGVVYYIVDILSDPALTTIRVRRN